jgi:hypothetical protein
MSNPIPRTVARLTGLALALACADGPTPVVTPPRIAFNPQALAFPSGATGAGLAVVVSATVTGVGPTPTLHWVSRAPEAVAIDSVLPGGAAARVRAVAPRGTFIVLTATGAGSGAATVRDSIPVVTF